MKQSIFIASIILLLVSGWRYLSDDQQPPFTTLCSTCPPGFELDDNNRCRLRTLYQMYENKDGNNPGVGGLKTALPPVRDGFTPQQIDLGRYLFFDPVLSGDGTVSCASCHQPDKGFSDGLPTSVGITHVPLKRAAPSLWNVAFLKHFFWDARASSLEEQIAGPLYAADEMGTTREQLLKTINDIAAYRDLFRQAFPHKTNDRIELNEVYTCIAAFEATLISLNSRYDQYAHGYADALTKNEIEGLNIFRSFVARCTECHTPPLFTNQQVAVIGLAEPNHTFDEGAAKTFNDPTLKGAFKVPSLRNAVRTAPYTHSGRFEKLEDMIAFYTQGRGHEVPPTEKLRIHWHIWEPHLRHDEIDRIADFISALTDESFKPQTPQSVPSGIKLKNEPLTHSLSFK